MGTCQNIPNGYTCTCLPPYSGSTCQADISMPCSFKPCQNGGTCNPVGSNYTCSCLNGYVGLNCDIYTNTSRNEQGIIIINYINCIIVIILLL